MTSKMTLSSKSIVQGSLFIRRNEFIDMTIFQGFINSPDLIIKLTEDYNKQTVSENNQTVSEKQTVNEKNRW